MATMPTTDGPGRSRYDTRGTTILTTSLRGFIDAAVAEGFPLVEDFNGRNPSGVGGYPVNVVDGVRQNNGLVYLTEPVRNRPNLKISGDVLVDRVLFDQELLGGAAGGARREVDLQLLAGIRPRHQLFHLLCGQLHGQ